MCQGSPGLKPGFPVHVPSFSNRAHFWIKSSGFTHNTSYEHDCTNEQTHRDMTVTDGWGIRTCERTKAAAAVVRKLYNVAHVTTNEPILHFNHPPQKVTSF